MIYGKWHERPGSWFRGTLPQVLLQWESQWKWIYFMVQIYEMVYSSWKLCTFHDLFIFSVIKVVTSRLSLIMVEQIGQDNDSCCNHHQYSLQIILNMWQICGVSRNKSTEASGKVSMEKMIWLVICLFNNIWLNVRFLVYIRWINFN